MTNISYRFLAGDARLKTGIGAREPNLIRISSASGGTALYGPYVDLPAGKYEAVIRFDPDTLCQGSATMDVCAGVGADQLAKHFVTADQIVNEGMTARIQFSCPRPVGGVEVRLFVDGEFSAGIAALEISGEPVDLDLWTVETADLPGPRVENVVRKGRNLYEGYQRGIGLTSHHLRARIAADPDFRRARELAGPRTIVGEASLENIFLLIKFYVPHLAFGHIIEFGSYKGGSAIFMAALADRFLPGARVIGLDTFSGMPITDRAVDEHRSGSFSDGDLTELRQYVEHLGLRNLTYVQGRFEETAEAVLQQLEKVVFCHIDCDIRSAVEYAYDTAKPYMVPGGYWVFDDPFTADCLGAAEAVEDLLIRRDGLNSEQLVPHYVFREPFDKILRP